MLIEGALGYHVWLCQAEVIRINVVMSICKRHYPSDSSRNIEKRHPFAEWFGFLYNIYLYQI